MAHICRGDSVVVTKGREVGKRGKVKRVHRNGRIEIEKIMMIKRHTNPTQKNPHGGIQDKEGTVAASNVALWCDSCNAARRSRHTTNDAGIKSRACVKCATVFPNPGM